MDRKNTTPVDPKAREGLVKQFDMNSPVAAQKDPNPHRRTGALVEAEILRLLNQCRSLEERLYRAEKDRSLHRVALSLTGTFGVYCAWACEWVNTKFLIVISAICIAVVAATLGSLWEKNRNKGGENNDPC